MIINKLYYYHDNKNMATWNFKCCENFKISKLIFNCTSSRDSRNEELEFHLLKQENKQYSFSSMLPESDNYLYLKIDKNGKIISVTGDYMKKFKMRKKDFYKKNLDEVEFMTQFFIDFLKPLHELAIEKGEAYQFLFNISNDENPMVCSIYPCYIPNLVSSVDVVVRQPQDIIEKNRMEDYLLKSSGEKVPSLVDE